MTLVENLYGQVLTRSKVERAVIAHVQAWLPAYLSETQRQEETYPDGSPLGVTDLQLPRAWRATNGPVEKWPEDQLPAVVFGSSGLSAPPAMDGRRVYTASWAFALSAVVSGNDYDSTEWLAGIYVAALRLLMVQQPLVAGLEVESLKWEGESYDPLPFEAGRSLAAGTCAFTLEIRDVANASGGPVAPPDDPGVDPGPWSEVDEVELDIERSPIG